MSFTLISNNIQGGHSEEKLRDYLQGPFRKPSKNAPPTSLAVFQEGTHVADDFKEVMPPWWKFMSIFPPQPFAFDSTVWDLKDMDGFLAYGKSDVGKEGAGPAVLTERHVQWLHLVHRERPRAQLHVFNTHAPPSISVPLQKDGEVSRDDLHEKLMTSFANKLAEVNTPAVFLGDFNCTYDHENMEPIRAQGMDLYNDGSLGTHGPEDDPTKRKIDLIMGRGGRPQHRRWQLECLRAGVIPGIVRGDHDYPWAELEFVRT